MEDTRDGLWHADPKASHHNAPRTVIKRGTLYHETRRQAFKGHWHRFLGEGGIGIWEHERCPHFHTKRSAAIKCAEQSAKRANKEQTS